MLVVKKMHSTEYHILHFRRILHIQYVIPKKDEVVQACHMHDNRSSITTETPKAPKYTSGLQLGKSLPARTRLQC